MLKEKKINPSTYPASHRDVKQRFKIQRVHIQSISPKLRLSSPIGDRTIHDDKTSEDMKDILLRRVENLLSPRSKRPIMSVRA